MVPPPTLRSPILMERSACTKKEEEKHSVTWDKWIKLSELSKGGDSINSEDFSKLPPKEYPHAKSDLSWHTNKKSSSDFEGGSEESEEEKDQSYNSARANKSDEASRDLIGNVEPTLRNPKASQADESNKQEESEQERRFDEENSTPNSKQGLDPKIEENKEDMPSMHLKNQNPQQESSSSINAESREIKLMTLMDIYCQMSDPKEWSLEGTDLDTDHNFIILFSTLLLRAGRVKDSFRVLRIYKVKLKSRGQIFNKLIYFQRV